MFSIRRMIPLIGAMAIALTACASAPVRPGWVLLGQRSVSDGVEHDSISVAGEGNFTGLKIVVEGRAVEFEAMTIHFANGTRQSVGLRSVIPAGGESRVIDVEGRDRFIRSVDFVYDAQTRRRGRNGGARIILYGRP